MSSFTKLLAEGRKQGLLMNNLLKVRLKQLLDKFVNPHLDRILRASGVPAVDTGAQILLALRYGELAREGRALPSFKQVGFRAFSQYDEDGILLFIFSVIGTTNKQSVEICAGDGIECNSANLIINFGWKALLFDGNQENVNRGMRFYSKHVLTLHDQPKYVNAWIEIENVNQLITQSGVSGEIDLLSIDVDGNDYWLWKAVDCINPRVVVLEYQGGLPSDRAVTIEYRRDYVSRSVSPGGFAGASLAALTKLAQSKNYRLVGCNRCDLNAFFIRNDLAPDLIPEVKVEECLSHNWSCDPQRRKALESITWVEV
jgi:hypothetical protein